MAAVEAFLVSGQAAMVVLLVVSLEALALLIRHVRRVPGRSSIRAWISPLLAGAALVVALLLAQRGADARWLGVALTVAGLAHLLGYRQRWYT